MNKHLISMLAGSAVALASAASHAAMISASSATVAAGTPTVNVSIDATGFPVDDPNTAATNEAASGGGLTISWDTNVITLDQTDPASGVTYDPMWDQFWNVTVSYAPGNVTNMTLLPVGFFNPTFPGLPANFHILDLAFQVVGPGTSAVNLSVPASNGWYDMGANPIATTVANGSVTVQAVPLPPAAILMLSGLLGVMTVARRVGA